MLCKFCGVPVSEDCRVCPSCGGRLISEGEGSFPEKKAPIGFTFAPEEENPYSGMERQSAVLWESAPSQEDEQEEAPPAKDTKKKIRLLTAGMILTVLVTAVLVLWMVLPFGPGFDILMAAKNTLEAGNLTLDFQYDGDLGTMDGSIQLAVDPEKEELTLYASSNADGGETVIAVYRGHLLLGYNGEFIGNKVETDGFFRVYQELLEGKEPDWEGLIQSWSEVLYEDMAEVLDFDILKDSMKEYGKSLNSKHWLETYAGFRQEDQSGVTRYIFRPKLYDFACASAAHMEPAFRSQEDYRELMQELADSKEAWEEIQPELGIGLEDGLPYDLDVEYQGVTFHLNFRQIGNTNIDTAELDQILENALILG